MVIELWINEKLEILKDLANWFNNAALIEAFLETKGWSMFWATITAFFVAGIPIYIMVALPTIIVIKILKNR